MANLVDAIGAAERALLKSFGRAMTYVPQATPNAPAMITMYVRGVRADDLFASAQQQDVAAVLDAAEFRTAFGPTPPRRFDRVRRGAAAFSVEESRGAPNDDSPVFYKLLLRGGTQ